ncbi:hypothetical protein D3C80_1822120 [compost metagenome]
MITLRPNEAISLRRLSLIASMANFAAEYIPKPGMETLPPSEPILTTRPPLFSKAGVSA